MAAKIAESEAAKAAIQNQQGPTDGTPADDVPGDGDTDGDIELEDGDALVTDEQTEKVSYANAAKNTWTLELHLYREDNGNYFHISDKELGDLVVKKLGVKKGFCKSADTSPYKKIILEIHDSISSGSLNVTQSLQIRKGLYTRPIQAPEKDRGVFIKWASMNFNNKDIELILSHFGEVTEPVAHVVIKDNGTDEWTNLMDGVTTSERKCRMKIWTNIPSIIMVRGVKLRIDYPGQPKTCSRCMKFWSSCPGGGKTEKCKKEGGEEKDLKVYFKNLVNRLKKKGKATETSAPIVPAFIPNPDVVRFTGFPEKFSLDNFKSWLDEHEISFLESMLFKETKPGVFSIATIEVDGEVLKLDAEEAANIISAVNGVEYKGKRIMVTMMTLNTPEKVKKQEVVTLSSSPDTPTGALIPGQLALPAPGDEANHDDSVEEIKTPERDVSESLKLRIATQQTVGGTTHYRAVGEKNKRLDDSNSSADGSPELTDKSKATGKPGAWAGRQQKPKKKHDETKPSKKKSKNSPKK